MCLFFRKKHGQRDEAREAELEQELAEDDFVTLLEEEEEADDDDDD